jgi:hypothetical protein
MLGPGANTLWPAIIFCFGTGVWAPSLMLARQPLYHLSHSPAPDHSSYLTNCMNSTHHGNHFHITVFKNGSSHLKNVFWNNYVVWMFLALWAGGNEPLLHLCTAKCPSQKATLISAPSHVSTAQGRHAPAGWRPGVLLGRLLHGAVGIEGL